MTVYLVGAGPGDPGLITRRGAELLARAEVVVHDRLVPAALVDLAPPGALRVDVGKRPGWAQRQDEINALLVEHGRRWRVVVRLKGGDPFVFGRGGEEAQALAAAGVAYEVVPGVSAAFAVPAAAGVPVTHRGLSSSVAVVTGRVGEETGGPDWESLAAAGTVVVLMGMEHRAEIARRLVAGGRDPHTPVLVAQWGTTDRQQVVRTTLSELAGVALGAPATIVVGDVAALELTGAPRTAAGALAGRHVVVTRARQRSASLVAVLEAAGATVQQLPVVRTAAPDDGGAALRESLAGIAGTDWVVFTSAVAVERVLAELHDARDLAGTQLAAVGPATAAALRAGGLVADLVADPPDAAGLVATMPEAPEGGRVLYPAAAVTSGELAPGLATKGWQVDEVTAYRTAPLVLGDGSPGTVRAEELDRAARADAVVFTSPSTLEAFVSLMGERTSPPVVVCIGPVTAAAARARGLAVAAEAPAPDVEGLASALVTAFDTRPR
ncbi:MAG: uroporphyrinogen-III C-methyltransferase [Acidimicrobiales bacterium]